MSDNHDGPQFAERNRDDVKGKKGTFAFVAQWAERPPSVVNFLSLSHNLSGSGCGLSWEVIR